MDKDLELAIRLEVAKQIASQTLNGSSSASFRADEYDIQVMMANDFPGAGWEYVACIMVGPGQVGIIWRMSRVLQAQMKIASVVQMGPKK